MSPDLERLLEAYDAKLTSPPADKARCVAEFERQLKGVLDSHPALSRQGLLSALRFRYREFRKARRGISTLPPQA